MHLGSYRELTPSNFLCVSVLIPKKHLSSILRKMLLRCFFGMVGTKWILRRSYLKFGEGILPTSQAGLRRAESTGGPPSCRESGPRTVIFSRKCFYTKQDATRVFLWYKNTSERWILYISRFCNSFKGLHFWESGFSFDKSRAELAFSPSSEK